MSVMKCAVIVIFAAIVVTTAEEAKSNQNSSPLTSTDDESHPNKRLAVYGSPTALNSGFKPITGSYPSVNNYAGNPQHYPSATSSVYSKASSYSPSFSPFNFVQYKEPSSSSSSYPQYQPLTFAASHPASVAYVHPQGNYAYSSVSHGPPQLYSTHNIPMHHYGYNSAQPINPVLHAMPVATFSNSYANTFYVNPSQIHKVPIYNQQPNIASTYHQSQNFHHHVKPVSHAPSQIITSKPVALESPIAPSAASSHNVDHSHGAVSFAHFSSERKPSAAPLIATQAPQQVYYHHQQPQTLYGGEYNKPIQYAAIPIVSNYYPTSSGVQYGHNGPYAHINRVAFAPPTSASTLIPSIAAIPQKVAFHS